VLFAITDNQVLVLMIDT